ncbi:hypothetical protein CR513_15694, partial [Mucuna pruriens]
MNKTPTRISLLSLLLNFEAHWNLLLKVVQEAHVAHDIIAEKFGSLVNNITSKGHLTFSDDEIPVEGKSHNQPLHISVRCGGYMIARILIDNGSSLNVLPKATLDKLTPTNAPLRASSVVVRAFDGSKQKVMGEISLPVLIGPALFNINLQVMDIRPAYSCLLGRPWIHAVGVVPSSLHQQVKFISDHRIISILGEKELVITTPAPEEYIEGDEEALETSFQSLEVEGTGKRKPEDVTLPPLVNTALHIMIKEGYQPGKGLGPHLEGIPTPILVSTKPDQFSTPSESVSTEAEALADIERWVGREKLKFEAPARDLESVSLQEGTEGREVRIGKQLPPDSRVKLLELLKEYADVFAWSYQDMPGLDREIVENKLPLLPRGTPVRQ